MKQRWGEAAVAAVMVFVAGCESEPETLRPVADSRPIGAAGAQLVAHDSCASALKAFQQAVTRELEAVGWQWFGMYRRELDVAGTAAAAERGEQFSPTNTHESAADEPDIVKTDGKRLVTVVDHKLRVIDVATRKQTVSVTLKGGYPSGLFIDGDRALVVLAHVAIKGSEGPATRFVQVDLTYGKVTGELTVDGYFVDARATDGIARLVVSSGPRLDWRIPHRPHSPSSPDSPASYERHMKRIVRESAIDDWLPRYTIRSHGTESSGRLVDCHRVHHPKPVTGVQLLTVLTVDIDGELGRGDPVSVAGNGSTVYGTGKNLYVIDGLRSGFGPMPAAERIAPVSQDRRTKIYQFDVSGSRPPRFVASGTVDGALLNQYSVSEHDGYLRVATTTESQTADGPAGRWRTESAVTVLRKEGQQLKQVGTITGLGKGERIYAVRFLGSTAYVVTFRQVDPLYRIDLSDPAAPELDGELKIPGYSSYLHPVGAARLLGIGQGATARGQVTGTQVSLFDTSGADPQRVAHLHIDGAYSAAENDAHAFLYWPARDLVVVPIDLGLGARGGALALRVSDDDIERVGTVRHSAGTPVEAQVLRSAVIGETLWTVSEAGAQANALNDLGRVAFVPFH
jgi:uncharacterized secreted protein with C-terminal beta-propeller domain